MKHTSQHPSSSLRPTTTSAARPSLRQQQHTTSWCGSRYTSPFNVSRKQKVVPFFRHTHSYRCCFPSTPSKNSAGRAGANLLGRGMCLHARDSGNDLLRSTSRVMWVRDFYHFGNFTVAAAAAAAGSIQQREPLQCSCRW